MMSTHIPRRMIHVLVFMACLMIASQSYGALYYLSPEGLDSNGGTSESTPWKTFQRAFLMMISGDELVLLDGSYSIIPSVPIPCGNSRFEPTIIRAKNEGSVFIEQKFSLGSPNRTDSCIKIVGITFKGGVHLVNTSYCYFKNCGFYKRVEGDDNPFYERPLRVGFQGCDNRYNLIEDCWAWGQAKDIITISRSNHTVVRRMVIRGDGCRAVNGMSNHGIVVSDSQNVSLQNIIVLDRLLDGGSPGDDFFQIHQGNGIDSTGPNEWLGCLSLKSPGNAFMLYNNNPQNITCNVTNFSAWDSLYKGFISQSYNGTVSMVLNHITIGTKDSYADSWGGIGINGSYYNMSIKNSLSYQSKPYGMVFYGTGNVAVSHCDVFAGASSSSAYQNLSCSASCMEIDPQLRYIVRIGAAMNGLADDGSGIGASIEKKYGVDGAFWGDANYHELSDGNLWPWPNEERIKNEMSMDSTRGFCDSGQSLTRYVWGYLGNAAPDFNIPLPVVNIRID